MDMKAIVLQEFGGVEQLRETEWQVPDPGHGEIRVKVSATSINPVDFKTRKGFLGGKPPMVLGVDLSGVVESIGSGVEGFSEGDEVYAFIDAEGPASNGSYAEYVTAPAAFFAKKPGTYSHAEAAAISMVGLTAYQCLFDKAKIERNESVFIAGGSGAVGTVAIQLARHLGANPIITTAGSDKSVVYLSEYLGVPPEHILRYKGLSVEEMAQKVLEMNGGRNLNATFDFVGGEMKRLCCQVVDFDGRVTTIVEEPEDFRLYLLSGGRSPMLAKSASFHFELCLARARFGGPAYWPIFGKQLQILSGLIEEGRIRPHKILMLDEFSERAVRVAHQRLEERHVDGKLVLPVAF